MTTELFKEYMIMMLAGCKSKDALMPVYASLIFDPGTAAIQLANCPPGCRKKIEIPDDMYVEGGLGEMMQIAESYMFKLDIPSKDVWLGWIAQANSKRSSLNADS